MFTTRRRFAASIVGAGTLTLALAACGSGSSDGIDSATGSQAGGAPSVVPPWSAPVAGIPALVKKAGLDLGPMGTAEHYHPTLRIVIDGEPIAVPPNIGVDPSTGAMSAVHTHEGDGTIHIEADTVGEVFTLGQLFTQWDVALGENQIGGVEADSPITVTVNGQQVTGDPAELRLRPDQQILLEVT